MERKRFEGLVGKQFDRWTVIEKVPTPMYYSTNQAYYLCRCECGTEKIVAAQNLRNHASKSCGCLKKELLKERAKRRRENARKPD